ncbi:MAG: crotonase/enoyl-CoA hydratase family protein [Rhodospirillales bacterium]|nr:crotonase/enoyl-CoA hydratase family protein [Rhodospirillales bacterium]MDH3913303.1 crotonase/enoyl-CoA hydratase family protein [Rhodospirillales bacterium]MDH3916776.1 crotonase/enoyl-CoA hydratase family protein [Rhodospirillales bacterium]MDH3969351.1 crotonase/enoyl-CoA hydratase family protein [Rhodospirillales bacterium]
MGDQVRVEKDGPVTTVILDRPEVRNAVDPETGEALVRAFLEFERDESASVAVFFGDHGAFCAGGDLKALSGDAGDTWLNKLHFPSDPDSSVPPGPLGPSRLELTKPTIAAVAGPAVAGGMELALWCDVRIMEEDAYFGVYCRRWGIPLIDGGTVRLPRIVGQGRALEIILTGRKVPAAEALSIGMCEKVVPKGEARRAAEVMAREIARFPQECTRADRNSVYRQYGLPLRAALRQEYENGLSCLGNEGVAGAGRFAGGKGRHGDYRDI